MRENITLVKLALRTLAGRRWWLLPLLPLAWPAFQATMRAISEPPPIFESGDAQTALIGLPMVILAIFFGARIIGAEIDQRTLEIVYTVPGGAWRVWAAKFTVGVLLLVLAEIPLALAARLFFTEYPLGALYGALQESVFYLAVAMGTGALFRGFISGAVGAAMILLFNFFLTGILPRFSPFFNPEARRFSNIDSNQLMAYTVQNRIGYVLLIVAVLALAWVRAERRERLLG